MKDSQSKINKNDRDLLSQEEGVEEGEVQGNDNEDQSGILVNKVEDWLDEGNPSKSEPFFEEQSCGI